MKLITATFFLVFTVSLASAQTEQRGEKQMQSINIHRSGSQPSSQGQAEYFTGSVRVDPLFPVVEPSRVAGARVTFEPGARKLWHTHTCRARTPCYAARMGAQWDGSVEEMREGDVVRIPPVRAWHGAMPPSA